MEMWWWALPAFYGEKFKTVICLTVILLEDTATEQCKNIQGEKDIKVWFILYLIAL